MLERGSPRAALIGRWGMALTLVAGAVLIGRLIRNFPYLLPNRLPGLVLYELGPALILVAAVGSAVVFTKEDGPRLGIPARLALFAYPHTVLEAAPNGGEGHVERKFCVVYDELELKPSTCGYG